MQGIVSESSRIWLRSHWVDHQTSEIEGKTSSFEQGYGLVLRGLYGVSCLVRNLTILHDAVKEDMVPLSFDFLVSLILVSICSLPSFPNPTCQLIHCPIAHFTPIFNSTGTRGTFLRAKKLSCCQIVFRLDNTYSKCLAVHSPNHFTHSEHLQCLCPPVTRSKLDKRRRPLSIVPSPLRRLWPSKLLLDH